MSNPVLITVAFPEGTSHAEAELLLRDALTDFLIARLGGAGASTREEHRWLMATHYVARRYADQDETFRRRKVENVLARTRLAEKAHVLDRVLDEPPVRDEK